MARLAAWFYVAFIAVLVAAVDCFGTRRLFGWTGFCPHSDKIGHLVLIGTATLALAVLFPSRRRPVMGWSFLPTSLFLAGVMVVEECSQIGMVTRTADVWDMVANLAGIVLADGLLRRIDLPGTERTPVRGPGSRARRRRAVRG